MATRKLKNFEFAGLHNTDANEQPALHCFQNFETPNGYVFVVSGSEKKMEDQQVCQIINERIKYYLNNEVLDDPKEAVRNALVYANGFIYEKARKDEVFSAEKASALCVLQKEAMVYYAWMGEVTLFLYNGKRRYQLAWPTQEEPDDLRESREGRGAIVYLGVKQIAEPALCEQPLIPVDGDLLFMGTGSLWKNLREKAFCVVMADNMPTHSKLQRLMRLYGEGSPKKPAAAQLIGFYNLDHSKRSFAAGKAASAPSIRERLKAKIEENPKNKRIRYALIGLGVLILAFMFYDLFLNNPRKPEKLLISSEPAVEADSLVISSGITTGKETQKPELPADVQYVVKSGDTWNSIYRQFEVCSWFIKNHHLNAGKFDAKDNPVSNTRLHIPVRYSGSKHHNPKYYDDFNMDKVGKSCENVNQAFKQRFDEKVGTP